MHVEYWKRRVQYSHSTSASLVNQALYPFKESTPSASLNGYGVRPEVGSGLRDYTSASFRRRCIYRREHRYDHADMPDKPVLMEISWAVQMRWVSVHMQH